MSWEAPLGCADERTIRERVAASFGAALDRAGDFTFTATIAHPEGEPWSLVLSIAEPGTEGASHIRRFTASSCAELGDAAVAAIAFALTDDQETAGVDAESGGEPEAGATEAGSVETSQRPRADRTESGASKRDAGADATRDAEAPDQGRRIDGGPSFFGAAELGPFVDVGALPKTALGAALRAYLGYGIASLRIGGYVLPEQRSAAGLSSDEDAGGEFGLAAASASLCAGATAPPGRLRLCVGVEEGRLTGQGVGVDFAEEASSAWRALLADVSYELPIGDSGLFALGGVGAVAPLVRTRFTLRDVGLAHQSNALSWRACFGLGWLFR